MMRLRRPLLAALGLAVLGSSLAASGVMFYRDDPIARQPETQDASNVQEWTVSDLYDGVRSSLGSPGEQSDIRALNVNTIDEVPDSGWFTNRIGTGHATVEEVIGWPARETGPAPGRWTIVEGKPGGIQPGFVATDSRGQRYFIKFDPPSNPDMASGAEIISTKMFRAFGYYVPENYIARAKREDFVIGPEASITSFGRERTFTTRDLDDILDHAAKGEDDTYRFLASKAIEGRAIGPFQFSGTRPDDPNDIVRHEHRRELRGLRVFAAWLNHHEVRSSNTFDTVVEWEGRRIVRHYLLDFGATLGSGSIEAQSRRAGNEYRWETRSTLPSMLTLGMHVQPWLKIDYPDLPSVGRIESAFFTPENWKPDFPNPAFKNARADDTFWAARVVGRFTDEMVHALVRTAEFADRAAENYLTHVLIERRDKILQKWLTDVNPATDFAIDAGGTLSFRNAAVDAGTATAPTAYAVRWAEFDNAAGAVGTFTADETSAATESKVPGDLLSREFLAAEVSATHPEFAAWARPVRVYFRRDGGSWKTVGLERLPGK
jgi:hypothetical protein